MAESEFPQPRSVAPLIQKEQLLRQFAMLGDILNAGTLLVDVRRTDYEGGAIRGSLNLPAQSFPMNMSTLYRLCAGDGIAVITRVIFYCGSSTGRGPRCAGWFQDHIEEQAIREGMISAVQSYVLEGGIKGWVQGGTDYISLMNGFVPSYWLQFTEVKSGSKRSVEDRALNEMAEDQNDTQSFVKRRRDAPDDVAME